MLAGPRRRCRREQHCVVAKAVTVKWLPQHQSAAEKRVFADRIRRASVIGYHVSQRS
jgi:hypothetical protein